MTTGDLDNIRSRLRDASARIRLNAALTVPVSLAAELAGELIRMLSSDPAASVRRAVVRALGRVPGESGWAVIAALTDPVWRVRNAGVLALVKRVRADPAARPELLRRLDAWPSPCPLFAGAAYALRVQLGGFELGRAPPGPSEPWRAAAWWNDDPAVLEQNLLHLTDAGWKRDLPVFAGLLALQDSKQVRPVLARIRELVIDAFVRFAAPDDLESLKRLSEDPRHPTAMHAAARVLGRYEHSGSESTADRLVEPLSAPSSDYAVWSWEPPAGSQTLLFPRVFFPPLPGVAQPRPLGRTGLTVSALGVSGRYGLPERGFETAIAAGVNLFFWEPEYRAQTRFWRMMPPGQRRCLVVVAGSFAVTRAGLRHDLDLARRSLGVERLGAFLVYWVRSAARLSDEVRATLQEFRATGAVGAVGISTHQRTLAERVISDGWDVVMLRHNFIHRGAEDRLLPLAEAHGTGVLVFSATCQGQTLKTGVSAADAYRYVLAQPGVTACWTAPRDTVELQQNLAVLADPAMAPDRVRELARIGDAVYPAHKAFLDGIRGR